MDASRGEPWGKRRPRTLTEDQVRQVRVMLRDKVKQVDIAAIIGCSEAIVSAIKGNRRYFGVGLLEDDNASDT